MKKIVFIDTIHKLPVLTLQNIRIDDRKLGTYICDIVVKTLNFSAKIDHSFLTEKQLVVFRNSLKLFISSELKKYNVEFKQFEQDFTVLLGNDNSVGNQYSIIGDQYIKMNLSIRDIEYGEMRISTVTNKNLIDNIIRSIESLDPIDESLWKLTNKELNSLSFNQLIEIQHNNANK